MAISKGKDLHSALKSDEVRSTSVQGLKMVLQRLQWSKDEIAFSLHASPNTFTTSGLQLTDALSYLGFQRQRCPFQVTQDGYCDWVEETVDLNQVGESVLGVHQSLSSAERHFNACGLRLPQPEGFGFFLGKESSRYETGYRPSGDGHTAPTIEVMKTSEDAGFLYAMTFIKGGAEKGWTFHYRPKHPPLSIEVEAAFNVLGLTRFQTCPQFDFDPCHWSFYDFVPDRGDSPWNTNTDRVHSYFGAHAEHFSLGLKHLLVAQATAERLGRSIFRMPAPPSQRAAAAIERATVRPEKSSSVESKKYQFDIALSFAGSERQIAEEIALRMKGDGFAVFYDSFYPETLWGKDLVEFFDDIYRKQARYCVMLISPEYRDRMWTQHERRSAQARALEERGREYILPILVAAAELPGMQPTLGYLNLSDYPVDRIAEILKQKLSR
jgi:hypothetical protein